MLSISPPTHRQMQAPHHSASQGDLDVLAMLTGENGNALGPLPSRGTQGGPGGQMQQNGQRKRQAPRRDGPMESLMLSAVMAGTGGVSRHHFGHGAARPYASCDESRPASPTRGSQDKDTLASRAAMRSMQAPRSERLRREREADEATAKQGESSTSSAWAGEASANQSNRRTSAGGPGGIAFNANQTQTQTKPHRRLSIDPAPVSATLQTISPPPFARPIAPNPSTLQSPSHSPSQRASWSTSPVAPVSAAPKQPRVRCMARTRIPTPHGDLFLHLYHNNMDAKEHLAIVLDPIQLSPDARAAAPRGRREIRSTSLDEVWREGETDMERVVRGAYTGRLVPGGEGQASKPPRSAQEKRDPLANGSSEDAEGQAEEEDILPMVRIHSECFTGETIGSMRCDCGEQLDEAIRQIASPHRLPASSSSSASGKGRLVPGRGVVIYMRQEGRGIGLLEKIRAYNLQDLGHDTVAANLMLGHGADERKYDVAAEILRDLGLAGDRSGSASPVASGSGEGTSGSGNRSTGIRLLTNNPEKVQGLAREGVYVKERVGMMPRDWKCSGQDDEPRPATTTATAAGDVNGDAEGEEKEYEQWRERRAGVGLIGAGKAQGVELEKYLRTKVERMGHMIDLPDSSARRA